MNDGYWKSVPIEYIENWRTIFFNNKEGPNLSISCPVCNNKELHRYYQIGTKARATIKSDQNIVKGAEWQWCSFCRVFEHGQVQVPDWWVPTLEIDGDKLTAIPEILDIAYQDSEKVNKWNRIPEQYRKLWDEIFSKSQGNIILNEKCPICSKKMLFQYYTLSMPKQTKYKKKLYKGQGAHWEWCGCCLHYKFNNLAYVPEDWVCDLNIEPWKLMTIPEPINEKLELYYCMG